MLHIHSNARTPPVTRAEIARSDEPSSVLAGGWGVSTETVRKWRKRDAADCLDRSARPHWLAWEASEKERALVCAVRRATSLALDELAFVLRHFLPHLNRDSIWRILRAEELNRALLQSLMISTRQVSACWTGRIGCRLEQLSDDAGLSRYGVFAYLSNLPLAHHRHCLKPARVRHAVQSPPNPSPNLTGR